MLNHELLINKGFSLNKYPEGKFYELTETKEEKVENILKVAHVGYDPECIDEEVILQLTEDFSNKILCASGYVWELSDKDFNEILNAIK